MTAGLDVEREGSVVWCALARPPLNLLEPRLIRTLRATFEALARDPSVRVAVLTGAGRAFTAGMDVRVLRDLDPPRAKRLITALHRAIEAVHHAPFPVIAAVRGPCLGAGLELALACDLRVAAEDAVFGVFCRRWGIPLMDGGTIRLTRLLGHSHALDLILTGRGVSGQEALQMGLANRLVPPGQALPAALALAHELAARPQAALRSDRLSSYEQWSLPLTDALLLEYEHGIATLQTGELFGGLEDYASGAWRSGAA